MLNIKNNSCLNSKREVCYIKCKNKKTKKLTLSDWIFKTTDSIYHIRVLANDSLDKVFEKNKINKGFKIIKKKKKKKKLRNAKSFTGE